MYRNNINKIRIFHSIKFHNFFIITNSSQIIKKLLSDFLLPFFLLYIYIYIYIYIVERLRELNP